MYLTRWVPACLGCSFLLLPTNVKYVDSSCFGIFGPKASQLWRRCYTRLEYLQLGSDKTVQDWIGEICKICSMPHIVIIVDYYGRRLFFEKKGRKYFFFRKQLEVVESFSLKNLKIQDFDFQKSHFWGPKK